MQKEIKLGNRVQTVSLKERELGNIAVFGAETDTKITLSQQTVEEMVNKFGMDVVVFDRQRKMRNLLVKTENLCYLTNVFPIENLSFNILTVPNGYDTFSWFRFIAILIAEMYQLNELEMQMLRDAFMMASEKANENDVLGTIEDVDYALEDEYRRKTDSELYSLHSPTNIHNSFVRLKHILAEWMNGTSNYDHLLFGEEPLDFQFFSQKGKRFLIELENLPIKFEIFIQKLLIYYLFQEAKEEKTDRKVLIVLKNTKNLLFENDQGMEANYVHDMFEMMEEAPRFGMYFMIEKQMKEQLPKEIEFVCPLQFEVTNMANDKVEIIFENKNEKEKIAFQKQFPYKMEQEKLIPFITSVMIEENAKEIEEELEKMNLELELEGI